MKSHSCFRCGRYLAPGAVKYFVHIRVFSDFDGFLSTSDVAGEEELGQILKEIELRDPEELENEVYQELGFSLCKGCRDRFVQETSDMGARNGNGSPMMYS